MMTADGTSMFEREARVGNEQVEEGEIGNRFGEACPN